METIFFIFKFYNWQWFEQYIWAQKMVNQIIERTRYLLIKVCGGTRWIWRLTRPMPFIPYYNVCTLIHSKHTNIKSIASILFLIMRIYSYELCNLKIKFSSSLDKLEWNNFSLIVYSTLYSLILTRKRNLQMLSVIKFIRHELIPSSI